jgi:hypothetical protein
MMVAEKEEKEAAIMTDVPDEVRRWTAKRKAAVALSIVDGETSAAWAARKRGLTSVEFRRRKEESVAAGDNALSARPRSEEAARDEQIERLKKKVSELVLEASACESVLLDRLPLSVVERLLLCRWDASDLGVRAAYVPPVNVLERGDLELLWCGPQPLQM